MPASKPQAGFLDLFGELAELLSAESAVVMTSRVSFLEDSPEVRRLMDGTSLMSEKLIQQLNAQGVGPLRLPRFAVLRLAAGPGGGSLLAVQLADDLAARGQTPVTAGSGGLAELLWQHITQIVGPGLLPAMTQLFGPAFLSGITTFTLADLANLGPAAFDGGRISRPPAPPAAARMPSYYVQNDQTGATSSFSYADILTEGFRAIRTGERIR